VPSTKPSRSRLSKNRKPWVSSTTVTAPNALTIRPANSKHMSIDRALMWNSRSPGVAGASWRGPRSSMNGVSSAGRGPENSRSQASDPIEVDHREMLVRVAEADGADQPGDVGQRVVDGRLLPFIDGDHQKMAAGVNGAVTVAAVGRAPFDPSEQAVRNDGEPCPRLRNGLCEFIDASPSPFHVCVTVAQAVERAGFTELSERDEWPADGRFFTVPGGLARRMAIRRGGPHRAVSDRRRPHRQPQSAGETAP